MWVKTNLRETNGVWTDKREVTHRWLLVGSETTDTTFEGLGEMFEGERNFIYFQTPSQVFSQKDFIFDPSQ